MPPKKSGPRPPTLHDVANRSGFAVTTVSHILGGKRNYKYPLETREKVLDAARKLNYQPHRSARMMRSGRSNLIGIINFGTLSEIAHQASVYLPQEINAHGYDYLVVDINWYGGNVERVINEMIRARVEGVIIVLMQEAFNRHYTDIFHRAGIPIISIFGDERLDVPVMHNDTRSAYYAMARHLQSVGHRRLVMTVADYHVSEVLERRKGFEMAVSNRGKCHILDEKTFISNLSRLYPASGEEESSVIVTLDMKEQNFRSSLAYYVFGKRLFAEKNSLPDAIMCVNDEGAFGLFSAAMEMSIPVPERIALTGFDNDQFGAMPVYGLTTVQLDVAGACGAGVRTLVEQIRNGTQPLSKQIFPTQLVLRSSCGRVITPEGLAEKVASIDPVEYARPFISPLSNMLPQ